MKATYQYDVFVETNQVCEQRIWFLFQCSACSKPILAEAIIVDREKLNDIASIFKDEVPFLAWSNKGSVIGFSLGEWSQDVKILYPITKSLEY